MGGENPFRRRLAVPPPAHVRLTVQYAALAWLGVRGAALLLAGLALPSAGAAVALAIIPAVLLTLDLHVLREWTLLRDWGVRPWWPTALALVTSGTLEAMAQIGLRAAGVRP